MDHQASAGQAGAAAITTAAGHIDQDITDLHQFGYQQTLRRTVGAYSSFALGFSMITITTTIFTLFPDPFQKIGGVAIWLWLPVTLATVVLAAVYGHLAARMPVTGYAYQWSSRIVSREYGWFSGWNALVSFFAGTASIAVALGTVFAPEIWGTPSHWQVAMLAGTAIVAAVIVNIISVRAATMFNNVGASTELVGTLGLTLLLGLGLLAFQDKQGFPVLFQVGSASGGDINYVTIGLAMLLPIYTLLGWEGSADLAEETRDPRRTAPTAMFRSVIISGIAAFFVYAIFAMAIPGDIAKTVNQTDVNPMISIITAHFGSTLTLITKLIVFFSIFSALLANVTVATRMCYSLARDKMLPGSTLLGMVNTGTRTPIYSVLLVGAVAIFINFLSEGVMNNVVAITAVTYFGTYLLTMLAAIIGASRGTIPEAPAGYFGLGSWLVPLAWIGVLWSLIVIGYMTLPEVNNTAGLYTIYFELAGLAWFVFYLHSRLRTGEVGPPAIAQSGTSDDERLIAAESR